MKEGPPLLIASGMLGTYLAQGRVQGDRGVGPGRGGVGVEALVERRGHSECDVVGEGPLGGDHMTVTGELGG